MQILNLEDKIVNLEIHNNEIQKSVDDNETKANEEIKKMMNEIIKLKEELTLKIEENIEIMTEKAKMKNLLDSLKEKNCSVH